MAATVQNAASGRYPHYKRLYVVTHSKQAAAVHRFIAFVHSPAGLKSWYAMDTGHPESLAHGSASDEGLVSIVSRVALSVALVVVIALPLAYWSVAYPGPQHHFGI